MTLFPARGLLVWLLGYQLSGDADVLKLSKSIARGTHITLTSVCLKMSDTEEGLDGEKPKGVFSTLIANGDWLYLKGEYQKAIESYNAVSS